MNDLKMYQIVQIRAFLHLCFVNSGQCDQKKSPSVYKSCPKMISPEKW